MTDATQATGQATQTGEPTTGATGVADTTAQPATGTTAAAAPATAAASATAATTTGEPTKAAEPGAENKALDGTDLPEKYEFKMPEGLAVDQVVADKLAAYAKGLKLSGPQAQQLADMGAEMVQRQVEAHQKTVAGWADSVRTDPEIGGDKLTENMVLARLTRETFGSPELVTILDSSGLGNHPEMVKLFIRIGKGLSEDKFVKGRASATGAGSESDTAAAMYPTMTTKG